MDICAIKTPSCVSWERISCQLRNGWHVKRIGDVVWSSLRWATLYTWNCNLIDKRRWHFAALWSCYPGTLIHIKSLKKLDQCVIGWLCLWVFWFTTSFMWACWENMLDPSLPSRLSFLLWLMKLSFFLSLRSFLMEESSKKAYTFRKLRF